MYRPHEVVLPTRLGPRPWNSPAHPSRLTMLRTVEEPAVHRQPSALVPGVLHLACVIAAAEAVVREAAAGEALGGE